MIYCDFFFINFIIFLVVNIFKCATFQVPLPSYMHTDLESVIYCCNLQKTLGNKICLSKVFFTLGI